jgi:hypothetical protein
MTPPAGYSTPKRTTLADGRRWYETEDGVFVSVTTALGVIDKPPLRPWIAKTDRNGTRLSEANRQSRRHRDGDTPRH